MQNTAGMLWSLALGVVCGIGCVLGGEPSDTAARFALHAGVLDAGDPEVGYLRVVRNDRGTAYYDGCTATVISPVVLLTAARCLPRPGTPDTFDGFYTGPGSPSLHDALPQNLTWHGVTGFRIYPGDAYDAGSHDDAGDPHRCPARHLDVAVVRLARPIHRGAATVRACASRAAETTTDPVVDGEPGARSRA